MDLSTDHLDDEFRREVRTFFKDKLAELFPGEKHGIPNKTPYDRQKMQLWTRALDEKGWLVPDWPLDWGGSSWRPTWGPIIYDEHVRAEAPPVDSIGIAFVGPVIYTYGTPEQRERFLPRIRQGDDFWCQGFSESSAGSDVTALRTIAIRSGDHFVINGQKLWTTNAHNADMMFALVRVDAPGNRMQKGLSFVLIDMRSPGITVRPIITLDGQHIVNEVFLENVRVPVDNLVGELGQGWVYARFLLARERTIVAQLAVIRLLLRSIREECDLLCGDSVQESKLANLEIEFHALEFMELRILHAGHSNHQAQILGPMLKLRATELRQRASELLFDLCGEESLELDMPYHASSRQATPSANRDKFRRIGINYLYQRTATIAGGTSEVQRNIIAASFLEA